MHSYGIAELCFRPFFCKSDMRHLWIGEGDPRHEIGQSGSAAGRGALRAA